MIEERNQEFRRLLYAKLSLRGVNALEEAEAEDWYFALAAALREMLFTRYRAFREKKGGEKKVAYLCMEFLMGRSLGRYLSALSLEEEAERELAAYGYSLEAIKAIEPDAGLGNGGLGRLAACFLESLTAQAYPAVGYSLFYEQGLFRQRLVDGAQVELPDEWTAFGSVFFIPHPEESVTVRFGGQIRESFEGGRLRITHTEYDEVRAIPYDMMVVGDDGESVNLLRLFRARDGGALPPCGESQANYTRALRSPSFAEELTRNLYPPDHHEEGKLLRLCQQYFLVSAAVANIISEHFAMGEVLERLPRRLAIHINDTHPALVIPELMRVLMDTYSYPWETAWALVHETVSYTNHTVLPEALETWRVDLFRLRLPRIYAIIEEINRRLTKELWQRHVGDWERVSRMAIIAYGQVRMAGLSVVASSHINGVSRLHTEILKKTVFSDYYAEYPTRFCSVTNGVTHRRWLLEANPALTALLDATIGNGYHKSPEELAGFAAYSEDAAVLARLSEVKKENKRRFSRFLTARGLLPFSEEAILDVHVKRLHEYKRQLLGALKVLSLYEEWQEDPHAERQPMVFLFGGKAAKSYYMAKEILRLLLAISRELSASPLHDALRLEFVEEYNVSVAEALIPAADISEQISLAGKEASGTGCMKLMMNGALTLGTRDGANIEIVAAAGEENAYLFGLREHEVEELWKSGYDARAFYRASPRLMAVIDRLYHPIGKENFSHIADYLVAGGTVIADPYMCLADFDAYFSAFTRAVQDYRTPSLFERKSLYNIAASGYFSSDRSVREYAEGIWHLRGVRLE